MTKRRLLTQCMNTNTGYSDTEFVLEFNITSPNTTITLGFGSSYNCIADWGDGTLSNVVSSDTNTRSHVYNSTGTYLVRVTGSATRLDFYNLSNPATKAALTQCFYLGDLGWNRITSAFRETNIQGPLLPGMFKYAISVPSFKETFRDCTSLSGPLPAGLFDNNIIVGLDAFYGTFYGCTKLSGTIPDNFFLYNINAGDNGFYETFRFCNNLTGDIPSGLFRPHTKVGAGTFYGTFLGCSKLKITPWIFYNNGEQNTRFAGKYMWVGFCFYETGLGQPEMGTLPDLWNCLASSYYKTYWHYGHTASTLTNFASIPEGW